MQKVVIEIGPEGKVILPLDHNLEDNNCPDGCCRNLMPREDCKIILIGKISDSFFAPANKIAISEIGLSTNKPGIIYVKTVIFQKD